MISLFTNKDKVDIFINKLIRNLKNAKKEDFISG